MPAFALRATAWQPCSELRSERRLVGSAGNAPVVSFQRYFMTTGLQTAGWITSLRVACQAEAPPDAGTSPASLRGYGLAALL
jgi:hypothetical protein